MFFEDLLDTVQKFMGIRIYPIASTADEEMAEKVIDNGRTLKEYIKLLNKAQGLGNISKGGKASIKSMDVYNMYEVETEIIW
jgi:hypothetical protein